MAIPKYDEILPAVLAELAKPNMGTVEWKELEDPLAKVFGLNDEELSTEYENQRGQSNRFYCFADIHLTKVH